MRTQLAMAPLTYEVAKSWAEAGQVVYRHDVLVQSTYYQESSFHVLYDVWWAGEEDEDYITLGFGEYNFVIQEGETPKYKYTILEVSK